MNPIQKMREQFEVTVRQQHIYFTGEQLYFVIQFQKQMRIKMQTEAISVLLQRGCRIWEQWRKAAAMDELASKLNFSEMWEWVMQFQQQGNTYNRQFKLYKYQDKIITEVAETLNLRQAGRTRTNIHAVKILVWIGYMSWLHAEPREQRRAMAPFDKHGKFDIIDNENMMSGKKEGKNNVPNIVARLPLS